MAKTPGDASRTKSFYRPELDVLRFFAFLMVFFHHLPWRSVSPHLRLLQQAGGFGVSIFFLLSSYLITELLMREQERTGTIHVRAFFIRRMLRIWPLYFLALAIALVGSLFIPAWPLPIKAVLCFSFLAGNLYVAHAGWLLSPLSILWSLSVEEQFYLTIPFLTKLGQQRLLGMVAVGFLGVAYGALAWLGYRGATPQIQIWANSLVEFQFFAAGTLLALVLHGKQFRLAGWLRGLLFLPGFVGLLAAVGYFHVDSMAPIPVARLMLGYLVALASTAAVFLSLLHSTSFLWARLAWLGRISFGLYVYHSFVLQTLFYPSSSAPRWHVARQHPLFCDLIALAVTIGLASLSYRFFELPIHRIKARFAYVPSGDPAAGAERAASLSLSRFVA